LSDQSICRKRKRVDSSCFPVERLDDTSEPKRHHPAALLPLRASESGNTMLKKIGCSRIKNLTYREKKMYYINRSQQQTISKLKFHLRKVTDVKIKVKILAQNKVIQLEKNFNSVGAEFTSSQFNNIKKKNPSWTIDNQTFARALYKRGPKCYRFLKKFLKLPSKSTLYKFFKNIPFETGINEEIFLKLKTRIEKMKPIEKICKLMFDEMTLSTDLTYSKSDDKIVGYEDLGSLGRNKNLANHSLVFMVQGLYSGWKQPISYLFAKNTVKSKYLKILIAEIIKKLQDAGLTVVCTEITAFEFKTNRQ
jgi:hypothetical protein